MSAVAVRQPWDKRVGESAKAFQAFSVYRDLGPTRTIEQTAKALGKHVQTLAPWVKKFEWHERADAYDFHLDRLRQSEREEEIARSERVELQAARIAEGKALTRLAGREAGAREDGTLVEEVTPLNEAEWDADTTIRVLTAAVKIRRLTHGQPTDFSKAVDTFSLREVSEMVTEIVELGLARMDEAEHEGFLAAVRAIGRRAADR